MDPTIATTLGLILVVGTAAAAAALLRSARCPGWPIIGGILAGILIGTTILGRVAPDIWNDLYVGAHEEQRELDLQRHAVAAGIADALDPDVEAELIAARDLARRDHDQPYKWALVVAVIILLAQSGMGPRQRNEPKQSLIAPFTIGLWAALLPGGLTFILFSTVLGRPIIESGFVACAVAIGPWRFLRADQYAASRAELGGTWLLTMSGRSASIIALVATAAWLSYAQGWIMMLFIALPLSALPLGWLINSPPQPMLERVTQWVLLPTIATLTMLRVDFIDAFQFWPALALLLLSGDGRWLGAFFGAIVQGGRSGLRTMRLIMGAMAAGPTQLALTGLFTTLELLSPTSTIALLFGIVLIEVAAPARLATVKRIEAVQEELDRINPPE